MKKIIISALAFFGTVALATGVLHAAGKFNTHSGDMPTITVSNATTNPCTLGPVDGCWKSSVSARAGDIVTVHLYFHNSTGEAAFNTMLRLSPRTSGRSTSHTLSGSVSSDNVGPASGSASVRISSSETLTFVPGSMRIGDNDGNIFSVPDESAVFSGGFNIGPVSSGLEFQGYLTADFRVSNDGTSPADYECDDGRDNDSDGYIDYPADPGCSSRTDDSEHNSTNNSFDCRIDEFRASDTRIEEGDDVTLRWETTGCDYVRLSRVSGTLSRDGSERVEPDEDTTYRLSAYRDGRVEDEESLTIRVDEDRDSCRIDEFKADNTSISRGQSTTLRWRTTDVDDVDITPGYSNRSDDGSVSVRPEATTTYVINASGRNCSDSDSVTVYVSEAVGKPQAITSPATLIYSNSAKLNGIVVGNTTTVTSGWFQWGPTASLGFQTPAQPMTAPSSTPIGAVVSGLTPNTTYYFRAVAQNQSGIAYGETLSFRTMTVVAPTPQAPKPAPRKPVTVVSAKSAPSLLELRIESEFENVCAGETIEYQVFYRNISATTLVDTVLQVAHQKEIQFVDASAGDYSASERMLTVDLGELAPKEEGSLRIRAKVLKDAETGELLVTTATVVYTNPKTHAQEDAIAYALNTISRDCANGLGANALFGGSFLPDTLIEWLILILVIFALILLGRKMTEKKPVAQPLA